MKIDSHQHFWKYDKTEYGWIDDTMAVLRKNHLPETLQPILETNKFVGTVAVQARQTLEETRWLLSMADQYDFIKGVVGWVDLRSENLSEQLHEFTGHEKFVGVRHVVQDEADEIFMLRPDFQRGIAALSEYNLTYDILIFSGQLNQAVELVKNFPNQTFILDHIAKPLIKEGIQKPWQEQIHTLASIENVCCKVSGLVTEAGWNSWTYEDFVPYLEVVFTAFGSKRILFGSDWPVCTVAATYDEVYNIVSKFIKSFSEDDRGAIFGNNAVRFYGLNS
jgi:L-fuconolactonase